MDRMEANGGSSVSMEVTGYLLVYYSNESAVNVWTNSISLIDYKGTLLEEKHYYPHGLALDAGQSSSNPLTNKYLAQGNMWQEEAGINLYDFHARHYDPQLGLFTSIDPLASITASLSPYQFCNINPANIIDPLGLTGTQIGSGDGFLIGMMDNCVVTAKRPADWPIIIEIIESPGGSGISNESVSSRWVLVVVVPQEKDMGDTGRPKIIVQENHRP